ncbi:MAG: hypothetical protein ABI595_06385 [Actinomycetota bacterium]
MRGTAMSEWTGVLDALPGMAALPPNATLDHIAMCPDYPGGCGWFEEFYVLLNPAPAR